jgi:hypothetical protein
MTKTVPAPASLVQEVEALVLRGERLGHAPSSRPEIYVGGRSWAQPARGGRPARITIDARLLDRPAADRSWVIGHELGHLLAVTVQPGTILQRSLMALGAAVATATAIGFVGIALPAGWASIPNGPAWFWCGLGLVSAVVIALLGLMQRSRDTETACDRASAVIYGQVMSEGHVEDLLRREGFTRLVPTALRTHPRPRQRWELLR